MPRRQTRKLTTQQRAARRWERMCVQNLKQLEDMRDSLPGIQTRLDKMQKLASEFNLQVNMSKLESLAQDTMKIVKEICPMPEVIVLEQFNPLSIDPLPSVACMEPRSPDIFKFPSSASIYSSISLPMEAETTPLSFSAIASIDLNSTEPQLLPPSSPTLSCSSIDTRGESISSNDNVCIYDHEISSMHNNHNDNIDLIDLNDEFENPKTISLVVRDVGSDLGCMEVAPAPSTVKDDPEPPIVELQQKQSSELMAKPPTVLKALTIPKATIQLSTTTNTAPAVPVSQVTAIPITTAGEEQAQWCLEDSGAEEQTDISQDNRLITLINDTTTSRIKTDVDESRPSEQDAKTSLSMLMSAFLSPKSYRSKWPLNLGLL